MHALHPSAFGRCIPRIGRSLRLKRERQPLDLAPHAPAEPHRASLGIGYRAALERTRCDDARSNAFGVGNDSRAHDIQPLDSDLGIENRVLDLDDSCQLVPGCIADRPSEGHVGPLQQSLQTHSETVFAGHRDEHPGWTLDGVCGAGCLGSVACTAGCLLSGSASSFIVLAPLVNRREAQTRRGSGPSRTGPAKPGAISEPADHTGRCFPRRNGAARGIQALPGLACCARIYAIEQGRPAPSFR